MLGGGAARSVRSEQPSWSQNCLQWPSGRSCMAQQPPIGSSSNPGAELEKLHGPAASLRLKSQTKVQNWRTLLWRPGGGSPRDCCWGTCQGTALAQEVVTGMPQTLVRHVACACRCAARRALSSKSLLCSGIRHLAGCEVDRERIEGRKRPEDVCDASLMQGETACY